MPKSRSHGDGALYYLPSRKLWRGVAYLEPGEDGKRRQPMVHARTQRACKEKLDRLKDEIRANGGRPLTKGIKFADWAERWFSDYGKPNLDPKTFATYRSLNKLWISPVVGHKPVDQIKPSHVTQMHRRIVNAGRSTSTARQAYIVLDEILEQARRERLCERNVCRDVERPGKAREKKKGKAVAKRDALDDAVLLQLLDAAAKRKNGSLYWFKILTGPRQGEGLGAVIEDLELPDDPEAGGYYTVNWKLEELASEHGCGEQVDGVWPCGKKRGGSCTDRVFRVPDDFAMRQIEGRLHLTEPKSQTGKRVPLIPQLAQMIRRDLLLNAKNPNPHGLIWRHDDGSPILPAEEAEGWRSLLLEVGAITEDEAAPGKTALTGHVARHSTITALAALDVDFQLIGEIVGQSTRRVTESYRHARDAERMEAMRKLGSRLKVDGLSDYLKMRPELPAAG